MFSWIFDEKQVESLRWGIQRCGSTSCDITSRRRLGIDPEPLWSGEVKPSHGHKTEPNVEATYGRKLRVLLPPQVFGLTGFMLQDEFTVYKVYSGCSIWAAAVVYLQYVMNWSAAYVLAFTNCIHKTITSPKPSLKLPFECNDIVLMHLSTRGVFLFFFSTQTLAPAFVFAHRSSHINSLIQTNELVSFGGACVKA